MNLCSLQHLTKPGRNPGRRNQSLPERHADRSANHYEDEDNPAKGTMLGWRLLCTEGARRGVIGNAARQLGVDPQSAATQIAQILPMVIDQLTPKGSAPQGGFDAGDLMKLASVFMNNR